jgi:methylmalonyl-CoA mutase cobalamin-binding domain/chain
VEPRQAQVRVLIAKVGADGHDRGVRTVARRLRAAGAPVICAGPRRTSQEVVARPAIGANTRVERLQGPWSAYRQRAVFRC